MSTLNKIKVEDILYDLEDTQARTELLKKINKVEGKDLSTNDFTNEDKAKLDSLINYDDTELRNEIDKKAYKNEIPSIDGLATEEYVNNAIANIDIPSGGGSGGGNANICNITVKAEQEVNGITVELPTTLSKFYMINFHIQFASGLTGEMTLYSHQGDGHWKGYNDRLPEGTGDVSLFGLFYSREYLCLGMSIAPFGVLASPSIGYIALPVSQNDKTITFFSDTAGVNFPAGSSISVWGVYES